MPLKPYEEFAKEPLAFPIAGKMYTPPPVGSRLGIALVRALAGDTSGLPDDTKSLWQLVLGGAYDEMVADDVPLEALARAGFATIVDFQNDREAAVKVWESGVDPEARAALMAAIRSTTQPSTRPAAASTTPRRASGTGTRKRATTRTASGSSGRKSSRNGR